MICDWCGLDEEPELLTVYVRCEGREYKVCPSCVAKDVQRVRVF